MSKTISTSYLLLQWSYWIRVKAGIPGYTSPMWALMRDNVQQSSPPDPNISDEMAGMIDAMIARMYCLKPVQATALWNSYRYNLSNHALGRMLTEHFPQEGKITHVKAGQLVSLGYEWIDSGLLHMTEAA